MSLCSSVRKKYILLSESAIYRVLGMSGVNFNLIIFVFTDKYVNLRIIASCLVAGGGKRLLATCV